MTKIEVKDIEDVKWNQIEALRSTKTIAAMNNSGTLRCLKSDKYHRALMADQDSLQLWKCGRRFE